MKNSENPAPLENPAAHTLRQVCRLVTGSFNGLFCRSRTEGGQTALKKRTTATISDSILPLLTGCLYLFCRDSKKIEKST